MTADPRKAPSPGTGAGFTPGVNAYAAEGPHRAPGAGASSPSEKRLTLRSPRAALEPERVPEPNRPSRRARHPIVVAGSAIFTLILLAAIAVGFAVAFGKQRLDAAGPLEQSQIVNIPRNVGPRDIADLLQREGVIEQKWVFLGGILVTKDWSKLKSGEYEFKKQASLHDVIDTLVEGKVLQHHLTVPEGLTSEQVVQRLMDNDVLSGNIKEIPREGTVLPDTYSFPRGSMREQLIQHMQQEQRRLVQDIWNRRAPDLPVKSPEQLVVLASLIEKETGKPDERTRVAAVFVNRLKLKMRLQSDPTIIYGLVGGKGTLGRPILRSEIDQPARSHRQPGPRLARSRGEPGENQGVVFRSRRDRWTRVRRKFGPAPEERGPSAPDRAAERAAASRAVGACRCACSRSRGGPPAASGSGADRSRSDSDHPVTISPAAGAQAGAVPNRRSAAARTAMILRRSRRLLRATLVVPLPRFGSSAHEAADRCRLPVGLVRGEARG